MEVVSKLRQSFRDNLFFLTGMVQSKSLIIIPGPFTFLQKLYCIKFQKRIFFFTFILMETSLKKSLLAIILLFASILTFAQCEILNRVSSDGSMRFYIEPFNLYQTDAKSLKACIVTDRESYFLELQPVPFPEKSKDNKLKDALNLKLVNGEALKMKHYDTRYVSNDSILKILYLIGKDDIDKLLQTEIAEFSINMGESEGIRTYVLKLHKGELKQQLDCLMKDEEKHKKK